MNQPKIHEQPQWAQIIAVHQSKVDEMLEQLVDLQLWLTEELTNVNSIRYPSVRKQLESKTGLFTKIVLSIQEGHRDLDSIIVMYGQLIKTYGEEYGPTRECRSQITNLRERLKNLIFIVRDIQTGPADKLRKRLYGAPA